MLEGKGRDTFKADLVTLSEAFQDRQASALGEVREAQLALRALLELEGKRLAKRFGARDLRVANMQARAAAQAEAASALDVEMQIAAIRVPRVEKADTLLHGRITDAGLQAVASVSVQLVNERGDPVAGVEPVKTDAAGYYAFVLKPEVAATLAGQKLSVAVATEAAQVRPAGAEAVVVTPGASVLHEVVLNTADLQKLKLRFGADISRPSEPTEIRPPREPGKSRPAKSGGTRAKPGGKGRGGGK
jgi:hypothetical protein